MKSLSSKVDLTENSDFGGVLRPVIFEFTPELIESIDLTSQNMTNDDYRKIKIYEHTFGKPMYTDAIKVFGVPDEEYYERMKTHCQRCGAELRIP